MKNKICTLLFIIVIAVFLNKEDYYAFENYTNIENTNLYVDDKTTIKELEAVKIYWDMLPHGIVNLLYKQHIRIYMMDISKANKKSIKEKAIATSFGPTCKYDKANGNVYYGTIKSGWTEYYSNSNVIFPESVIHEVGHHIDWISVPLSNVYKDTTCGISDSFEWTCLYNENKDKMSEIDYLASKNTNINKSEGFAEAFRLFCEKPEILSNICPDIYYYLENIVTEYSYYE